MTVIFIINTSLAQRQSSVHNFRTDTVDLFNSKNDLQFTKEYLQEIRKKEYMKNQPNFYIVWFQKISIPPPPPKDGQWKFLGGGGAEG